MFVASSSCSEDDTSATSIATQACQQQPVAETNLTNGFASSASPKTLDVRAKGKKSPSKVTAAKRMTGKDRGRMRSVESEKKVEEEALDSPPDGFPLRRVISIEEDHLPHLLQGGPQPLLHQLSEEEDELDEEAREDAQSDTETSVVMATAPTSSNPPLKVLREAPLPRKSRFSLSARGQPVGKETQKVRQWLRSFKSFLAFTNQILTACVVSPSESNRRSSLCPGPSV